MRAKPTVGESDGDDAATERLEARVTRWYADMASCWLEIEPPLRRRLVLRTHRWIVDSVFDGHPTPSQLLDDLGPAGALRTALAALVPDDEAQRWRPWIRLVLQDLRRAVLWPPSPRTEAWCRWLFLIPYSVPIGAARREAVRAVPTT